MSKSIRNLLTGFTLGFLGVSLLFSGIAPLTVVEASSHREAPLIAQDPLADGTDTYAFISPDRPNTVTILANFIPDGHRVGPVRADKRVGIRTVGQRILRN